MLPNSILFSTLLSSTTDCSTSLLPTLSHSQEIREFLRLLIIRREDIIDIFLVAVVIKLPSSLRLSWHLFLYFLDIFFCTMSTFEGKVSIEKRNSL